MQNSPPSPRPTRIGRLVRLLGIGAVLAALGVAGTVLATEPVGAATQGVGFGTWAPVSTHGWHGSMRVGAVHTYCITPGGAVPTGATDDRGISASAAGLSPAALTGINLLVSKYGQTEDPVQAASVGWAVKAIANWNETLHAFSYPGGDLRGAINWTFSALAPEHNQRVQDLASAYYTEATNVPVGAGGGRGSVVVAIEEDDPLAGSVRVDAEPADARGTLVLERAVFAESDSPRRSEVVPGETYRIRATAPDDGAPFRVAASGTFRSGYSATVRHFTTAGGQDTAGPAGPVEFPVAGSDEKPRTVDFEPTITTQVVSRYQPGGRFEDEVTFTTASGAWPRGANGDYLPVAAKGTVYRTDDEPDRESARPPEGAEKVATLSLTSAPGTGPTVPYRVATSEKLPGPGVYTAVWTIAAKDQTDQVARRLPDGYEWREPFGERTQITLVPDVSSRAQEHATVGEEVTDTIVVRGPLPAGGLVVSAALYRAPSGTAPADSCTDDTLVWDGSKEAVRVTAPGDVTITAPALTDFGTYYWRELARDADGTVVHRGACGVASETTTAIPPTVTTKAIPEIGFGGEATDTAIVAGRVPTVGRTTVTFELFRGETGEAPSCTPETRVADTSANPVPVPTAGEYTSPAVRIERSGPHHWIESLWWTRPGSTEPRLLGRGECGAEGETTLVRTPSVTTVAVERAATGEPYTDTATVAGLGANVSAELMFFVYRGSHGEPPVCTAETLETTTAPVTVSGDGSYTSPAVTSTTSGVRNWIAQLQYTDRDGATTVLHRGECGEKNETTYVDVLAVTGPSGGLTIVGLAAGAAIAGGGSILLAARWRNSRRPAVSA